MMIRAMKYAIIPTGYNHMDRNLVYMASNSMEHIAIQEADTFSKILRSTLSKVPRSTYSQLYMHSKVLLIRNTVNIVTLTV